MPQCVQGGLLGEDKAADAAMAALGKTGFRAGGGYGAVCHGAVSGGRKGDALTAQLHAAVGAAGDQVIAAGLRTGGGEVVFRHGLAGGVSVLNAQGGDLAAGGAGIGQFGAGGICQHIGVGVAVLCGREGQHIRARIQIDIRAAVAVGDGIDHTPHGDAVHIAGAGGVAVGLGSIQQKEFAVGTEAALIRVGHVNQVAAPAQLHDVPHMTVTGNGVAGGVVQPQVTEVLEGLGISLADHIGGVIPVKDIDQLPGVAVAVGVVVCHGIVIVGYQRTDRIRIGIELLQIVEVLCGLQNSLGICQGGIGLRNGGGIHRIAGAALIGRGYGEIKGQAVQGDSGDGAAGGGILCRAAIEIAGLIEPVAFIGAVHKQALHDFGHVDVGQIGSGSGILPLRPGGTGAEPQVRGGVGLGIGGGNLGGGAVAGGNFGNSLLQGGIDGVLVLGEHTVGGAKVPHGGNAIVPIEQLGQIALKKGVVVCHLHIGRRGLEEEGFCLTRQGGEGEEGA